MRAILTYHSIDASGSPISIAEDTFRAHVAWLASGAVRVVALEELLTLPADASALAVTFDDGFQNFAAAAWPVLRDHDVPATVFIVSESVGRRNDWESATRRLPQLRLMDWDTLMRLTGEGVRLGGHSRRHPRLPRLSAGALADEVAGCAERIAGETGTRPTSFAYPYGAHDARVVDAVAEAYTCACTTELAELDASPDPYRLPRLDAHYFQAPGAFDGWGSAAFRRRLWMLRGRRRVRRLITPSVGAR